MKRTYILLTLLICVFLSSSVLQAQVSDNPLSEGPFEQLIIRGAMLINGNGAPPRGPVDVVVEGNTITRVQVVGYPGVPIDPKEGPNSKQEEKRFRRKACIYCLGLLICTVILAGRHKVPNPIMSLNYGWPMGSQP